MISVILNREWRIKTRENTDRHERAGEGAWAGGNEGRGTLMRLGDMSTTVMMWLAPIEINAVVDKR